MILSVGEEALAKLIHDGYKSDVLNLRVQWKEFDNARKVLSPLVGLERIYPRYLPTQKSGRWSTTKPNLPGFSENCINPQCEQEGEHRAGEGCWSLRDVIVPDPDTFFLKWDWSAIEAKLAAAYSGDDEDLDLFARDADIHTYTYCRMRGYPLPPDVMNPYKAESCVEWRRVTGMTSKLCWQRAAGKVCRYNLAYGVDERSIHASAAAAQLGRDAGLDKTGLEAMAKSYLDSKPKLKAWKRAVWNQIMSTHEVRTSLGRRKRLFPSPEEYQSYKKTGRATQACKQGLNHLAQGQVADMMNLTIIAIKRRWPESRLAFQSHDGWLGVFPNSSQPWPEIREIVEREWDMGNGRSIKSTADWQRINTDGSHEDLR